ncbi:BTAD domain-containing putative transcriptional regulator [Amycolatopsis pigmentata]|uniref:BTAD domain-containing putative transcriptional regulator n=1 Tax=Amycolatopsis pigmentata TaxID=450801 RepID=A0ABW5FZQ0_9PSEU
MPEPELRVAALGSLRAWLDGEELELGPARQRAVFAVLATRAVTQPVTRPELISAVWGDAAPASANGSVHTYVFGLRRVLDPNRTRWSTDGLLVSGTSGYRLRLAPDALDINVFDRLRETAGSLRQAGDVAGAVKTLEEALSLWRGEPFSGVPGPFAESERTRLTENRLLALEQRASGLLELGSYEDLVPELTVLVHEHPLRESLWASLMIALHRANRTADALDAFARAREILRRELDVLPGPELAKVHQQILTGDPALNPPDETRQAAADLLSVVPAGVAHVIEHPDRLPRNRGRAAEIAELRRLLDDVAAGRGGAAWIEGEPGIGKSALLAEALADAGTRGCHLGWTVASSAAQRFPLQVITACLGPGAGDAKPWTITSGADPVAVAADRLLAHIDDLCTSAPLVLVVDDFQWADEMSVLMWSRLSMATRQLPLLLVAAARRAPWRNDLTKLRQTVTSRGHLFLALGPLSDEVALEVISDCAGAKLDPACRPLAAKGGGNPLYLREATRTLMRENALEIRDGFAYLKDGATYELPASLGEALDQFVERLDEETRTVLSRAAVLGMQFEVSQVAATMGCAPSDLLIAFEQAMEATSVVDAGTRLAFRHPLIRDALYEKIAPGDRPLWHRDAAAALARMGAGVEQVAQQLAEVPVAADDWVFDWLVEHHVDLSNRAPLIAVELLGRVLESCGEDDPRREILQFAYVLVLYRLDREPEQLARDTVAVAKDPARAAEMRHIAAAMAHRRGDTEAAIALLERNGSPETPALWQERRRSLLANFSRGGLDDLDLAARRARATYRDALAVGEPYPIGHALQTLWLVKSIERDHAEALLHIDQAIAAVEGHEEHLGLYFDLLDNRMFSLQNLDRLDEADETLRTARATAARHHLPDGLQVSAAVHHYWAGRWSEALAELDTVTEDGPAITFHGLREPGPTALLLHGVAAMIHGRRGHTDDASRHLTAADGHLPVTDAERESCDFLLVARSVHAGQRDDADKAIGVLAPILDIGYAPMMLRHQWLPGLTRLATANGRPDIAEAALAVCEEEAARETTPARAVDAAGWCRALVTGDPEPLLATIEHYRAVGRQVEMATAQGDAAILLAKRGHLGKARTVLDEAVALLAATGAHWDVRRIGGRMKEFGIDLFDHAGPCPMEGMVFLSAVETKIAKLVAGGRSNPEIAQELGLPRRTVQAHVAGVLSKLRLSSRADLAHRIEDAELAPGFTASGTRPVR